MECPVLKWEESRIISTFSVGLENPIQFHNDSANSNASRPNGKSNVRLCLKYGVELDEEIRVGLDLFVGAVMYPLRGNGDSDRIVSQGAKRTLCFGIHPLREKIAHTRGRVAWRLAENAPTM